MSASTETARFGTSAAVRRHLVEALRADLIGPFFPDDPAAPEVWDMAPSKRYLYGFLVPRVKGESDDDDDDDPELADDEAAEAGNDPGDGGQDDPAPKRRPILPSSIGLSVLLAPAAGEAVQVRVCYADYQPEVEAPRDGDDGARRRKPVVRWRRVARPPIDVDVPLTPTHTRALGGGLTLYTTVEAVAAVDGLDAGTRALAVFVVNERDVPAEKHLRDQAFVFQVALEVRSAAPLVARPDLAGLAADAWDDQVMDLQFRAHRSFAVGHGVATDVIEVDGGVVGARTEWLPTQRTPVVRTRSIAGATLAMEALAELASGAAVHAALDAIPRAYAAWIAAERARLPTLDARRRDTAEQVLFRAERAHDRIRAGIDLLATEASLLQAFATANRAMAMAARQRSPRRYETVAPAWRMFQLAFVLLNLPGVADPASDDREIVELIFFPTGGGKTEAYLGVIAFALAWRRMRHAKDPGAGLGVAVILRYTLRLLTLDQLGRAATLICALERLRAAQPELGTERFSLGLWVGQSATANKLSDVARQISEYRNGSTNLSPFPLAKCPWCGADLEPGCLKVVPNTKSPAEVEVGCARFTCEFSARHGGLPIVFVDEQVYRELPSFLIATVDKFAMLPWRGESGALFGQVTERQGRRFAGRGTPGLTGGAGPVVKLPHGLLPPELIVQDELHLISGPLGTMVGLYETAIEYLACRPGVDGRVVRPKLIASTATVKRAQQQVQALYGKDDLAMFPPPGIDDGESFFAEVDHQANGRLYLGVAATGRSAKAVLVTVYAALLAAAARCAAGHAIGQPADPYLTLVGYFNNLRELGGMRRLVEDLVRARAATRGELCPLGVTANPWMASRTIAEPLELTSRESTSAIGRAKAALEQRFGEDGFIDTALASNMISVGVDIERLGLMVVAGQPKSTSEYIQASSRVGRDDRRPGLVVTCYNLNKPRDRSYFEHFRDYHATFYRRVEPTSVTPFSSPALERGLAGCLLAMIRHRTAAMTPPDAAMRLDEHPGVAQAAVAALVARGLAQPGAADGDAGAATEAELRAHATRVIDRWATYVAEARGAAAVRSYSPYDVSHPGTPLLWTALDEIAARLKGQATEHRFVAPTSMRDVEPTVHLWLKPAGWSSGGAS